MLAWSYSLIASDGAMRALSLDKPSTMGRFLLTSIEDAHKRVDCMPCHELRLKPFIYRMQRKGLRRETNRRTVTSVSDVAAPRCAPGFHIIRPCDKDNTVHSTDRPVCSGRPVPARVPAVGASRPAPAPARARVRPARCDFSHEFGLYE